MSCLQNEGKLNNEKLTVIERERNIKVILKFRTAFIYDLNLISFWNHCKFHLNLSKILSQNRIFYGMFVLNFYEWLCNQYWNYPTIRNLFHQNSFQIFSLLLKILFPSIHLICELFDMLFEGNEPQFHKIT